MFDLFKIWNTVFLIFFYKTAGKMHFYICYVPKRRLYITYSLESFTVSKHGNKIYYIYNEKVNVFFLQNDKIWRDIWYEENRG